MQSRKTGVKLTLAMVLLCLAVRFITPFAQSMSTSMDEEAVRTAKMESLWEEETVYTSVLEMIPVEQTWDIEDTHALAEKPLIRSMRSLEGELGCDNESRTFYLPMQTNLSEWPQIELEASGEDGLTVAWADDYAYDFPGQAVSDNQRYRLIAWTAGEYEYVDLVFTGLPMVMLHTGGAEEIEEEYVPVRAQVFAPGYETVSSMAQIHRRGGGFRREEKLSLRLEFAEKNRKGRYAKGRQALLGMPEDSDWLLISNESDETLMRNAMGWQLWKKMNPDGDAFSLLESRMVEVCLDDRYMGVYALQQRIRPQTELQMRGFESQQDVSARIILSYGIDKRPVHKTTGFMGGVLELRYKPDWMTEDAAFARYDELMKLSANSQSSLWLQDDQFVSVAEEHTEIQELMRYFLFFQAAGLGDDNVKNNLYIWAVKRGEKTIYLLSPWDMDQGFNSHGTDQTINYNLNWPIRLLNLNALGSREALWAEWNANKESVFSEDAIYDWTMSLESEMNASGAWRRECERWAGRPDALDLTEDREFLLAHLAELERSMREIWPLPGMLETGV